MSPRDAYKMIRMFAAILATTLIGGCAVPLSGKDGTRHRLILGLGWVNYAEKSGLMVQDLEVLGLVTGQGIGMVGFSKLHRVEINPQIASNVIVAVRSRCGGLFITNFAIVTPHITSGTQ